MRFVSTRGESPAVDLETALLTGLATDGGLFMPETLPPPTDASSEPHQARSLADIGTEVAAPFMAELSDHERRRLITDALDFAVPLVRIHEELYVLELFHGPTLSFKDVGARFMARLMERFLARSQRSVTVLVATSGDTGSAAAQAFAGSSSVRLAVLYPRGKVSPLQEKQMTTVGGNVQALAVEGDFDDCQRLAKQAFASRELRDRCALTSANSINIGRLLPQMFYYFHAVAQLPEATTAPIFSVPSGNFGNLTAGLMASRLGLRAAGFIAATNLNDSVPRYLESGDYRPLSTHHTLSNAMDVGDPSNFQRMLWLFDGSVDLMRQAVRASRHDDAATVEAMQAVHDSHGYLLDPHTAVGYLGLRQALGRGDRRAPGIVLATAHPAKFREEIGRALGFEPKVPDRLARCLTLPSNALEIEARLEELAAFLRRW